MGYDITRNQWQTDRVAGGGAYNLSDTDSLNFTGWYGQGQMFTQNASNTSYTIFNPKAGTPFVSQTEKVTYHHIGGSLFYKGEWGDLKDITIGADARDIWAHDPLNVFAATGQIGLLVASAKHQFQGLFAQATWKPEPNSVAGDSRRPRRFLASGGWLTHRQFPRRQSR